MPKILKRFQAHPKNVIACLWLLTRLLTGQLLGITQRAVVVDFDHSKERYSRRKLIPVNPKTLGDHLHLKRIEADLSQPEVAKKTGVSVRMVRKWEYGLACPNEGHWQALKLILSLTELPPQTFTQSPE